MQGESIRILMAQLDYVNDTVGSCQVHLKTTYKKTNPKRSSRYKSTHKYTDTTCDIPIAVGTNELWTITNSLTKRNEDMPRFARKRKPYKSFSEIKTFAQFVSELLSLFETKFDRLLQYHTDPLVHEETSNGKVTPALLCSEIMSNTFEVCFFWKQKLNGTSKHLRSINYRYACW